MPVITKEPQNVTVGQYDRAEFTVGLDTTTDATVYTWYLVLDGVSAPIKLQQSRKPTYVVSEASTGVHKYFCEIDIDGDGVTVLTSRTCLLAVYPQVTNTADIMTVTDWGGPSDENVALYKSLSPEQYPKLTWEPLGEYEPAPAPDEIVGGGSASDIPADGHYWEQVDAGSADNAPVLEDYIIGNTNADTTFVTESQSVRPIPGSGFIFGPSPGTDPQPLTGTNFSVEFVGKSPIDSMPNRSEFDEDVVLWEAGFGAIPVEVGA